jgi:putrescine---pyruvate transaminase
MAQTCGRVDGLILMKNKHTKEHFRAEDDMGMVCRGHYFGNGLITRAVGDRMMRPSPLVITLSEVDEMMQLIQLALDLTPTRLKRRNLV